MTRDPDTAPSAPQPPREARPSRRGWVWLMVACGLYFAGFAGFPNLFFALGVAHYDGWFIDLFALLASSDAYARGLNPYLPNPLDYFQRPHVYSHWWLYLHDLGLTRADCRWLGLVLVVAFLLTALWRLRPQVPRQFLWYLAVMCSSPVLLALDRGNNDLVIFILLTPLVPCLLSGRKGGRLLAPLLVAAAAVLKYYPAAAALLLLAYADRAELRPRLLITVLLMALAGWSVAGDLAGFGPRAPQPAGLMSFGVTGVMHELGWMGRGPKWAGALLGLAVVAWNWRRAPLGHWEPSAAQRSNWLHLVLGAALLTGCFFTSMNFAYRWIFAIWMVPALWLLPRDPDTPAAVAQYARWTGWLVFIVLWWPAVACFGVNRLIGLLPASRIMLLAKLTFLVEQPVDWALFFCLLVFLTHFARRQLAGLVRSA
jgi:hypothetical protein